MSSELGQTQICLQPGKSKKASSFFLFWAHADFGTSTHPLPLAPTQTEEDISGPWLLPSQ